MGELHPTAITLRLADRSFRTPKGVLRDVPIRVGKFFIPVDFYVLEMNDEQEMPVILGRPFLNTVEAVIRCGEGSIELKIGSKKLKFYLKNALSAPSSTLDCNMLDISHECLELTPLQGEVLEENEEAGKDDPHPNEEAVLGILVSKRKNKRDKAKAQVIEHLPSPKDQKHKKSSLSRAGFYRRFVKKERPPLHKKIFQEGDMVLICNSRHKIFSGKFKSTWSGPFKLQKKFNDGCVELMGIDGQLIRANGDRIKPYQTWVGGDNLQEAPT